VFFVEAETEVVEATGGPAAPVATSGTTPSNYGLVFDVTKAFELESVKVYPDGSAGTVTILLQTSTGTVLETLSGFALPAGNGTTAVTIPLGWSVPVGSNYRLVAQTGVSMVRDSSLGGFPYELGDLGAITSGYILGLSTNYYYF